MRGRPYTRGGTALVLALTISSVGAASAGAISVAGVDVPLTQHVQLPHVPTVALPNPTGSSTVGSVTNTVNSVTSGATDTVNDAVDSVNNATGNPAGVVPPDPVPSDPVGSVPNPLGGGSGSGSGGN